MAAQMMKDMLMTSVGDVYREFIPSEEGESLDEQIYPWGFEGLSEKLYEPLPVSDLSPQTVTNILQMRSTEMHHWMDYMMFAQMVTEQKFKKLLNSIAWVEHLHFWKLHSLLPAAELPSEDVLKGELALMACYDMAIQTEPNEDIKQAFQQMRMDHLYHAEYAANQVQSVRTDLNRITGGKDLGGGRPLNEQFTKPENTFWKGSFRGVYDKSSVEPQTLINVDMVQSGELAAWNMYGSAASWEKDVTVKLHFSAFSGVENQHVSILGSIKDPGESLLEKALVHERVEMHGYSQLIQNEPNETVRKVFEDLYEEDKEHARLFGQIAG